MTPLKPSTISKAAPAIAQTATLLAQMEVPIRKVLQGLLSDFERFSDLVTNHLEPGFDQFDGYDGIQNRGDLGDILASEWAISTIDPIEFTRRLAMLEALFRRKTYDSNSQGRAVCLIIDCGAWMLGHNRLLGLAAVFWLATHSERLGFDFYWCHTARPEHWNHGLKRAQIEAYLKNIAQQELTQTDLDTICQALPVAEADNTVDLFLVGSVHLERGLDLTKLRAALLVDLPQKPEGETQAKSMVRFWSRGGVRRSSQMTLPDDGLCIAALRRPFPVIASDQTVSIDYLSDTWAGQHWAELPNGKVAIRWPEGLLITPAFFKSAGGSLWIPLDKDAQIIGIAQESETAMRLIWWSGEASAPVLTMAWFDTGPKVVSAKVSTLSLPSGADTADLNFGPAAVPVQSLVYDQTRDTLKILYDRVGRPAVIELDTGQIHLLIDAPVLLARDGGDQCIALTMGDVRLAGAELAVERDQSGRTFLIGVEDPIEWARSKRDIRITASDIAVLLTRDGITYDIRERSASGTLDWPQGLVPMQMQGPRHGFGYNPATGGIVQVRAKEWAKPQLHPKTDKGAKEGASHLRGSRMGRFAYGVKLREGQAQEFVKIQLGGKGRGIEVFSVEDRIAEARTIWLKD